MGLAADFRRDVKQGTRLLARFPGSTAMSIAILAIAIGANTAVFAMVDALLLTPPPVVEPTRLVRIDTGESLASWPTYEDIRARAGGFTGVAAHRPAAMTLQSGGAETRLRGELTSLEFLSLLRVPAALGRTYAPTDETFDRVVLAHHIWRRTSARIRASSDGPSSSEAARSRWRGSCRPTSVGSRPPSSDSTSGWRSIRVAMR
jgi:putative ABC transport system permease protein